MIAPNDTRNWQVSMDDPAAIVEGWMILYSPSISS